MSYVSCEYCTHSNHFDDASESAQINCNMKLYLHEKFTVWRCCSCGTLHSKESVDLSHYYKSYITHHLNTDGKPNVWSDKPFGVLLKRLKKAGFLKHHSLLDYGCGNGGFISFLKRNGYENVFAYDKYGNKFNDSTLLSQKYDFVFSQDVIEHDENPSAFFAELTSYLKSNGVLYLGTPDADKIRLSKPIYMLQIHQPYHRHIFTKKILKRLAQENNLATKKIYSLAYRDTLFPFINQRFVNELVKIRYDNVADGFLDDPLKLSDILRSPKLCFYALFGYFFALKTELAMVFNKQ